jgi:tetratricopeptide (TPR) repeat protein
LFERATRERPSFADAWLALGTQQLAAGNLAGAKDSADAAVKADSSNVAGLVLAGKVALAGDRPDDALRDAKAALKLVANSAAAMLLVADSNAKKGEVDLALEAYQTAWGLDHSDPSPLVHASQACHAAARDTSARAYGAKAAQEFPNFAPGWAALGDALVGQKEMGPARDAYRKALAASDGSIDRGAIAQKLAALQ